MSHAMLPAAEKKGAPSCLVNATLIRSALSSPEPCMECTNMRKHQLVVWLANDVYAEHTSYMFAPRHSHFYIDPARMKRVALTIIG